MVVRWKGTAGVGLVSSFGQVGLPEMAFDPYGSGDMRLTWIHDGGRICVEIDCDVILAAAEWLKAQDARYNAGLPLPVDEYDYE